MTQVIANRTDMYESHFGLKKRPFRALAAGNDVFVGPQAASTLAGLKKALSSPDAIVSVSGPIGVGKTTIVNRAVNAIGEERLIVSLGRIHLGHDDVLELLLEEMGADPIPASTVQRFTKFRRMLRQHSTENARVVIVVEDASIIGVDAIAELEALTATDAGVSDGANIVLMGERMEDLLGAPAMSRLQQRLRLRLSIQSLSSNELHGYLKHCFRLAGNDFDTLFEQGTSELLFTLSNGIPRIANNLVESALTSAAEDRKERVTVELLRVVAADEYGIDVGEPPAAVEVQPEPEPEPESEPAVEPEPAPEPETASAEPAQEAEFAPEPQPVSAAPHPVPQPVVDEEPDEDPIPELIQDTLPDLEILAPALANAPAPERSTADVPAWERDPTLAQLRPDLDALEHAMAVAQGTETDGEEDVSQESESEEIPELVPEITLDKQILAKIEEATELLDQAEQEAEDKENENDDNQENAAAEDESTGEQPATPVVDASPEPAPSVTPPPVVQAPKPVTAPPPPAETEKAEIGASEDQAELEKIAEDLSRAKTIDDVDDKMAETLFGEEFSDIAAQVAAKVAAELPANDDLESDSEELAVAIPAPDLGGAAAISVELEPELRPAPGVPTAGSEAAASQRLATVRALNGTPNVMPPQPPSAESIVIANDTPKPESIEDQMNTSITQTLKALNVRPAPGFVVEDYDDEKKGFFSRFRKS
ncbi:MAG: AAA family ATPase [Desulfobulbaceae bacterium]|nr:AAA family ATPase [Desulfobulbaceae bacterium]